MFRVLVLFAFVACACAGAIPGEWGRIVNGENTTIEQRPYQVSLQYETGFHMCGGSIISEDIVVTAAHCLQSFPVSKMRVRLGATEYNKGGELVAVKSFRYHEGYNSMTLVNDVGVIKLATPVRQSSTIRYIKLAERTPVSGTTAVVSGWGTLCHIYCADSKILQEVEVDIVSRKSCASNQYQYGSQIKETMLCAYGVKKDACQGDSGGPLVANGRLVGIVSWGIGCAREGYPGVYCDVAEMHDWIEQTAKEL